MRPEDAPADDVRYLFKTEVPAHALDVVLGRPTKNSVTASVLAYADVECVIEYRSSSADLSTKTQAILLKNGVPAEVMITGLQPDTRYAYRLHSRASGGAWASAMEGTFQTQRAAGKAFVFTMQADPHLDYNTEPALICGALRMPWEINRISMSILAIPS